PTKYIVDVRARKASLGRTQGVGGSSATPATEDVPRRCFAAPVRDDVRGRGHFNGGPQGPAGRAGRTRSAPSGGASGRPDRPSGPGAARAARARRTAARRPRSAAL